MAHLGAVCRLQGDAESCALATVLALRFCSVGDKPVCHSEKTALGVVVSPHLSCDTLSCLACHAGCGLSRLLVPLPISQTAVIHTSRRATPASHAQAANKRCAVLEAKAAAAAAADSRASPPTTRFSPDCRTAPANGDAGSPASSDVGSPTRSSRFAQPLMQLHQQTNMRVSVTAQIGAPSGDMGNFAHAAHSACKCESSALITLCTEPAPLHHRVAGREGVESGCDAPTGIGGIRPSLIAMLTLTWVAAPLTPALIRVSTHICPNVDPEPLPNPRLALTSARTLS